MMAPAMLATTNALNSQRIMIYLFPGQGSQTIGMGKDFFENYELVKDLFKEADDSLSTSLSKIILEGPKDELDLTVNTQPAIFLISY